MSFDNCFQWSNHFYNQDNEFHHFPYSLGLHLSQPLLFPHSQATTILFLIKKINISDATDTTEEFCLTLKIIHYGHYLFL